MANVTLEVVMPEPLDARRPVICASHPVDQFVAGTAKLLADAAHAPALCINPRGIGASPALAPGERYPLEAMVDELEATRVRLGVGPWIFWGLSGGGWLAPLYARRHPRGLAAVIIESACACLRERLADPACIASPFHPLWRDKLAAAGLLSATSHASPEPADDGVAQAVDGVGHVFRRPGGPALLVAPTGTPRLPEMMRAAPELWAFDARSWLHTIDVPTLVICGTDDPVVPTARARAVHERIPGSRFVAVAGAGHVPVTQHRREVAEAVRAFLAATA